MDQLADDGCVDPSLGQLLTSYCFGGLSTEDFQRIEAHLLECEPCWQEFQRLDAAVRTLRFNEMLRPRLPLRDVASMLGLSGRLHQPFAGHLSYALTMAFLFGLEWTVGVWSELGYSYDRFGTLAWALSLPVGVWVAVVLALALWSDAEAAKANRLNGLGRSAGVVLLGLAALVVSLMFVLPAERTILASFQTRTASAGFFKDALLIFLPLLAFILPPFDVIVRLQAEIGHGRHRQVSSLLSRHSDQVWPRGVLHLSPALLSTALLVLGTLKITGANHMLDALTPGPYANLFTVAAYISTGLWFGIVVGSLWWYWSNLNELRRECQALELLDRHDAGSTKQ